MRALIALPGRTLALWLSAFISPTVYFLLLLLASRSAVAGPLAALLVWLLFVVPVVALLVCEWAVWRSEMTVVWKIGWMLFTLVAMLFQTGVLLACIRAILVTAIGYAQ